MKTLFGFERVHVRVGETVSVSLLPALAELAAVAPDGERYALPGEYSVSYGVAETAASGMGYATTSFVAE